MEAKIRACSYSYLYYYELKQRLLCPFCSCSFSAVPREAVSAACAQRHLRLLQQSPEELRASPGTPAQPYSSRKHPSCLNLGQAKLILSYEPVSSLPVTLQNIREPPQMSQLLTHRGLTISFAWGQITAWEKILFLTGQYYRTVWEKLKKFGRQEIKTQRAYPPIRLCQKSAVSLELFHAVPWHKNH